MTDDRRHCPECGTEPRPIGCDEWNEWWYQHWTVCRGVTLDERTLRNMGRL